MKMNKNYYAIIMAGGVGSRFWPVSKESFPKQFHDMLGTGQTLLQKTASRLEGLIPKENIPSKNKPVSVVCCCDRLQQVC
jgi:mannose-1-phosphate guanylyltransferase